MWRNAGNEWFWIHVLPLLNILLLVGEVLCVETWKYSDAVEGRDCSVDILYGFWHHFRLFFVIRSLPWAWKKFPGSSPASPIHYCHNNHHKLKLGRLLQWMDQIRIGQIWQSVVARTLFVNKSVRSLGRGATKGLTWAWGAAAAATNERVCTAEGWGFAGRFAPHACA